MAWIFSLGGWILVEVLRNEDGRVNVSFHVQNC